MSIPLALTAHDDQNGGASTNRKDRPTDSDNKEWSKPVNIPQNVRNGGAKDLLLSIRRTLENAEQPLVYCCAAMKVAASASTLGLVDQRSGHQGTQDSRVTLSSRSR